MEDLYTPQGVIWEEVTPPQYKGMTKKRAGPDQNELVNVKHMRKQYLGQVPRHTITNVLK